MTQNAELPDLAIPDYELLETKYKRLGHIDAGKVSDKLAIYCHDTILGDRLPKRWKYESSGKFVEQFGEGVKWAITASYHGLFLDGEYIFRIWTDTGKDRAIVDINSHLYPTLLLSYFSIDRIPLGSHRKSKPMVYRIEVKDTKDIDTLIESVHKLYKV